MWPSGADRAAACAATHGPGARPVLDDDRPLELVLQFLRQHARQDVGAATGRKRAEERDGALRVVVGGLRDAREPPQ